MMERFLKRFLRRSTVVDPKDLDRQTAEINEKLAREKPHMDRLAAYLVLRKDQNGFGADFEYTLRPKET